MSISPAICGLGEREARINEAYRPAGGQEEELEAYLEHGRISVEQALSLAPSIDAGAPARPRLSVAALPGTDGKQPGAEVQKHPSVIHSGQRGSTRSWPP